MRFDPAALQRGASRAISSQWCLNIGTSTTRFVAEPTIRIGPNDHAARARASYADTDPSDKRLVLFAGKPTWKPNAQLFEELHGEAVEPPANPGAVQLEEMRAVQAHLAGAWRTATRPPATSEPPLARSSQAYRAPGMQARFVRRCPSKPNVLELRKLPTQDIVAGPPRRVARRWRHVRHLIHFGLRGEYPPGRRNPRPTCMYTRPKRLCALSIGPPCRTIPMK